MFDYGGYFPSSGRETSPLLIHEIGNKFKNVSERKVVIKLAKSNPNAVAPPRN